MDWDKIVDATCKVLTLLIQILKIILERNDYRGGMNQDQKKGKHQK